MNLADAFATKIADLLKAIDPADFNPVRCCVCVALGHREQRAETIIRGYAVCLDHLRIDEYLGVAEYASAIERAFNRKVRP